MDINVSDRYKPLPNQAMFHQSGSKFRAYIGGFGSGKTKAGCWDTIELLMESPGNFGVICRNTYPELRDTTMRTFFEECPEELIKSTNKTEHSVVFHNGSEVIFRSLDDPNKFKSLNIGFFFIDEASDVKEEAFLILQSRLRNKNSKRLCGFITSNPSTTRHWMYKRFAENPSDDYHLIKAPTSENHHLPEDYIESLRESYDDDWIKRFLDGEFGFIAEGEAVYPEFKESIHVDKSLKYLSQFPVVRSWDFGIHHPAVIISQIIGDRLVILKEILGDNELIEDFGKRVKSYCEKSYGKGRGEGGLVAYEDFCDPAGNQKSDKNPKTSVEILRGMKIYARSRSQHILDGVQIVRMMLHKTQIDAKPSLLVHPSCTNVIEGLMGGYHYPQKYDGTGEDPKPFKDGYYDHLQDCIRYLVWNTKFKTWINFTKRSAGVPYGSFQYWQKHTRN